MLDRAPRRRVRLSGRKRRSQGKGRSRDVVVEIRDHLQRAKDEMDRRVSLGEDPQKVAEDLTRESLEQGALSEAQENAGGNQSLDQVRVLGSNRLQRAGNYRRALIKLYNGADVLTVAHEFGELWLKEMVEDGVYTWEEVAGWVNAAREKLGESGKDLSSLTQPGELQTYAREGWVDLYELYLLDQHHSLNLPQKVLEYFRKLTEILSRAVKRALMLREALASESLPAELKQSFQDAARMHFREETTGFSGRADGNEISGPDNETLQAAEDSTNYSAASEWDERGEIPDAEFELIPEFLEDGTEEELRILLRLRPSQRPQRRLYNLRRVHEAFAPIDVGNQIPSSEAEEGNVGRWNGSPRHRDSSAIQEAHRKEEDGRGFLIDDPNLAAYANADVVLEKVSVNLSNIEEQFQSFGEDEIGARRFIDALLDEEIIHYLERWPVKQRGEDGWASFIHLADSALEDQSRAEALVQAWNGYRQIPRDAPEEVRATVAKLRRSKLDGYRAFGELIRQIIQLRTTGRVTEQVEEPTVLEGFSPRGGYETFVRVVSENVLEGKWGQELKAVILDTEARFESLEDPSIGPAEPGETTHSLAPENPNQRFRLLQGTQEQASPAELDLVRRLGLSRNTQIRLLQLMSEAQANGRQRPVLVEDDTLQDAGAQYEPDEGIIRINPAILEEEATQFEDRIDRRRMIDAIIDEELIHWHLAQSYQQPSAAEVEEAYEAMMERFVSEYPHVLLEAYRTYTKSHSPDLKPISLEEFMSDDAKVAEAFDEFVRQIVQLQTTGRITEEVSHPWPERDLGPSCWLGKYRDSLEHSYRMALGRHWGAEMQAIVEQAEARAQTAVETYSMAPDESDQWGPSEAELELERWKEQAGDAEFIEMVNLTSRMRAVQAKHKHHLFPQEKRK